MRKPSCVSEKYVSGSRRKEAGWNVFDKRYWPGETAASVLGRPITFAFARRVVVGVAGDVRMRGLERQAEPQVYLSHRQVEDDSIPGYIPRSLAVRTATDPAAFAPAIRAIIRRADPLLPVSDVSPLTELVDDDTSSRQAQLRVIADCGHLLIAERPDACLDAIWWFLEKLERAPGALIRGESVA